MCITSIFYNVVVFGTHFICFSLIAESLFDVEEADLGILEAPGNHGKVSD